MRLFESIKVGDKSVSSRIAMAPLTRYRSPNHIPTEMNAEYYAQRAQAYPGTLLIAEATFIRPESAGYKNAPGIWSKEQIIGWKKVTDAVHKHGAVIYCQLWDPGAECIPEILEESGFRLRGSSQIPTTANNIPEPLSEEEVHQWVQWFAEAAVNAIEAGFDGVEIHAAIGYLLDQFIHEHCNDRSDNYGGSIENRARFTIEVVDEIIKAIGAEKTAIRLSPWGTIGDLPELITPIPQYGHIIAEMEKRRRNGNELAYIHVVEPRPDQCTKETTDGNPHDLNQFVRDIWDGVVIRAGALDKREIMERLVEKDNKLLIAVGRYFISNPDFILKIENGGTLDHYDRDTFYWFEDFPIEKGYTVEYTK